MDVDTPAIAAGTAQAAPDAAAVATADLLQISAAASTAAGQLRAYMEALLLVTTATTFTI